MVVIEITNHLKTLISFEFSNTSHPYRKNCEENIIVQNIYKRNNFLFPFLSLILRVNTTFLKLYSEKIR